MCFGRPSPPPLPEPRPTPPKPEKPAQKVVVGDNRTRPAPSGQQITTTGGRKRTGKRVARARRLGTAMLRIPLNPNQSTSDLRY